MNFECQPNPQTISLPEQWEGLLLLDKYGFSVKSGQGRGHLVNPLVFSKLLAFADVSHDSEVEPEHDPILETIPMNQHPQALLTQKSAEYWFIGMIMNDAKNFNKLANLLRRTEHYWLVRFLLNKSGSGDNLHALGQHYGVSDSHFRRLCKQALGHSTKTELRLWRVARALLETTDRKNNFTEIAVRHGYASSSHFSNDVKELLGISPRALSDILKLVKK